MILSVPSDIFGSVNLTNIDLWSIIPPQDVCKRQLEQLQGIDSKFRPGYLTNSVNEFGHFFAELSLFIKPEITQVIIHCDEYHLSYLCRSLMPIYTVYKMKLKVLNASFGNWCKRAIILQNRNPGQKRTKSLSLST